MPATISIKRNGAYGPQSATLDRVKVEGVYVDATNLRMKVNGVYEAKPGGTPPVNLTLPVIAGALTTGSVLTCTPGTWSGSPTPALIHQWFADGSAIVGARGLTYTLTVQEAGKSVVCREIGANGLDAVAVISNALVMPIVLGPERLIDPDFSQGTDEWNTTGWTFGGSGAVLPSFGIAAEVYSISNAVVAGKRYQFQMVVSANSGAQLRFNYGAGTHYLTTGTHTELLNAPENGQAGIKCDNTFVTATVASMSVKEVL